MRIRIPKECWFFIEYHGEVQFECRTENLSRCIRQFASTVVRNVRFHLGPVPAGPFTFEIVGQREDIPEDLDTGFSSLLRLVVKHSESFFWSFYLFLVIAMFVHLNLVYDTASKGFAQHLKWQKDK